MPREITKEEFAEWLQHPVTQLVRQVLHSRREGIKEHWAGGGYTAESNDGTRFLDAGALGEAAALQGLIDMDVATVNSELKDDE